MKPTFFETADEFRRWLEKNHDSADEVIVGFYKKSTGKQTLTWSDAVDQALCFGWIDGVRRKVDDESYSNRFTPRRPNSNWSSVNIAKVRKLEKAGLMRPAGLAAFERRRPERSGVYSFERDEATFSRDQQRTFRANKEAWRFFQEQAPYYRRTATWWVISAKREETRARRLARLIEDSAAGRRLAQFS